MYVHSTRYSHNGMVKHPNYIPCYSHCVILDTLKEYDIGACIHTSTSALGQRLLNFLLASNCTDVYFCIKI